MLSQNRTGILFVTRVLPFESGGTPIIIRNLLKFLPSKDIVVLGRRPDPKKRLGSNNISQKMYKIPILYTKGYRFWKYYSILPGLILGVYIIKKHQTGKIIGVFQDDSSLILSLLLSWIYRNRDYYPYFIDLYAEQKRGFSKVIATWIQRKVFKRAKYIFVSNEGIKEHLQVLYPNRNNFEVLSMISPEQQKIEIDSKKPKEFNIVFSGSINEDRIETLRVFTNIIKDDKRFKFVYLSPQNEEYLRKEKVFHNGFTVKYCSDHSELARILSQASLLYLPLRFTYPIWMHSQLITCFGTKTLEYIHAGVPILIHSPENFYNYKVLKERDAAFLLNTLDEKAIKFFLDQCFTDDFTIKSERIVQNAYRFAKGFNGGIVAKCFLDRISKE